MVISQGQRKKIFLLHGVMYLTNIFDVIMLILQLLRRTQVFNFIKIKKAFFHERSNGQEFPNDSKK